MKLHALLFTFIFAAGASAQVNLNLGLKAYYPFTGNANDASGNNNNPAFNNATLTTDRFGNANSAYHFNGSSSYMRIANSTSLNMSNKISLVAWVKVTGFYTGLCHGNRIIMKGDADYLTGNYLLTFDDNASSNGQNCFTAVPDTLHENFYGVATTMPPGGYSPYIQKNQWYCLIFISDGITASMYVNCELKASGPAGSISFSNANDLFFGRMNSAQYPYWFNGDLDDVRIYDRALTTDEINTLGGCAVTGCKPAFQKKYGGNKADLVYGLVTNTDGSTVAAGYTSSFGSGGNDGYVQKTDKNGNLLWSRAIGGTGNDVFYNLNATPDGGLMALGISTSFGGSATGVAWIVKLDANGNLLWSRKYDDGNPNGSIAGDYTATADGGFAITATNRYAGGVANAAVIKADAIGNVQWAKSFDSGNSDECWGITEDADSLVVLATQYGQAFSVYDAVLMKLNRSTGAVNWCRSYEIDGKSNRPDRVFKTTTGYSFNSYQDVTFSMVSPEMVVMNTDINGIPVAARKISDLTNPDLSGAHAATSDGGMIIAQNEPKITNGDIHLIKLSSTGTIQWSRRFGGTGLQAVGRVVQAADGGYVLSGNISSTPAVNDSNDVYIIKTDSLGNTPGCTIGTVNATIAAAPYTFTPNFGWAAITNLAVSGTTVSPTVISITPAGSTYCAACITVADTIVNSYTAVTAFDKCKNVLTVTDAAKYKAGDTVLLIQMKGAVIDSSNTVAFGNITHYKNAGNYEFNYIKSKNGNLIELRNVVTRQYDLPDGKVQLIRVPFFKSLAANSRLTCQPWDGSTGGVLVLNVADTLSLNADIDVSGKGFAGGAGFNTGSLSTNCFTNNYNYPLNSLVAAQKGESITSISNNIISGKGAPASGGGGGLDHNSGGGGGSNGGAGGLGGYQLESCGNAPFDNRGIGGRTLSYSAAANKIFMGGGGGAGHSNNPGNIPSAGGNGGGIIIINSSILKANGYRIMANGNEGLACSVGNSVDCHDGMGGGGGGGTVLLQVQQHFSTTPVEIKGGNGANMVGSITGGRIGAGGGGGGGVLLLNTASLPAQVSTSNAGGTNGVLTTDANNSWGATAGGNGTTVFNLALPVSNVLFKPTFDSAKLHIETLTCTNFKFWGLNDAVTAQIVKWRWATGDGYTDSVQTFTHNYLTPGTYPVKLVATDTFGCVATFKLDLTVLCRCEAIKITSPNPAGDFITVSGLGCGFNTLILYNMLGQKVKVVSGDHPTETFNVSNLAKGMYVVKIINKDKIVAHLKVEKM
ncbi:MAG: LamG-like jellyroll fold domain-containing protein [Ferruginibacter sp.]